MRILVTGSRDWPDDGSVETALRKLRSENYLKTGSDQVTVVHGDCPTGADAYAKRWARSFGEAHPADWKKHGKAAGPLRNKHMVNLGADICLAFILNQSKGASGCADLAEKAGITTVRHERVAA